MTATGISLMHAGPNHAAFGTGIDHTALPSLGPGMHTAIHDCPTFQSCSLRSIIQTRFRTQQASFLTSQSQVRPRVGRCMRVDSCGG